MVSKERWHRLAKLFKEKDYGEITRLDDKPTYIVGYVCEGDVKKDQPAHIVAEVVVGGMIPTSRICYDHNKRAELLGTHEGR